jgi:hypothetical protein
LSFTLCAKLFFIYTFSFAERVTATVDPGAVAAAAAAPLPPAAVLNNASVEDGQIVSFSHAPEPGSAYCFLPLPVLAGGLPAHVNGYFELSSNRRDIW